jgi:MFS family permease
MVMQLRGGLWRDAEFRKLGAGAAVSGLGDAVTGLALPLTAVAVLGATPAQMGLLVAAGSAPHLVLGLVAGVWVDRLRRRPVMVASQLGRAAVLATIPAAAWLGLLRIEHLYLAAFLAGSLAVFADAVAFSFLPLLVGRARVLEGNARLAMQAAVVSVVGPGLAGALIQLVTAPVAILADALSFLLGALCWSWLRVEEPPPRPRDQRAGLLAEIAEGWGAVFGEPVMRASTVASLMGMLAVSVQQPVLVLFLARDLGLAATTIGAVLAAGGVAGVAGAAAAAPLGTRFGPGPTIAAGSVLSAIGMLLIPLAGGPPWVVVGALVAGRALIGAGGAIYTTSQLSLRQLVTPDHVLGRSTATRRFLVVGLAPLGALVGGALGERLGTRPTLAVGALGMLVALAWVLLSPVMAVRAPPATVDALPGRAP